MHGPVASFPDPPAPSLCSSACGAGISAAWRWGCAPGWACWRAAPANLCSGHCWRLWCCCRRRLGAGGWVVAVAVGGCSLGVCAALPASYACSGTCTASLYLTPPPRLLACLQGAAPLGAAAGHRGGGQGGGAADGALPQPGLLALVAGSLPAAAGHGGAPGRLLGRSRRGGDFWRLGLQGLAAAAAACGGAGGWQRGKAGRPSRQERLRLTTTAAAGRRSPDWCLYAWLLDTHWGAGALVVKEGQDSLQAPYDAAAAVSFEAFERVTGQGAAKANTYTQRGLRVEWLVGMSHSPMPPQPPWQHHAAQQETPAKPHRAGRALRRSCSSCSSLPLLAPPR